VGGHRNCQSLWLQAYAGLKATAKRLAKAAGRPYSGCRFVRRFLCVELLGTPDACDHKLSHSLDDYFTNFDWASLMTQVDRRRGCLFGLATGGATSHLAQMFDCSASRISQLRRELFNVWQGFQGEATMATSAAPA
jgi:hypothetical protein